MAPLHDDRAIGRVPEPLRHGGTNLWIVTALILLAAAAIYHFTRSRADNPVEIMRDSLAIVRAGVDSCRSAIQRETERLTAYDDRLDSMRSRVREFESIDPRGVPADSYAAYLEAFSAYNDSVPGWRTRADSLRAHWSRCRELTESHNQLADSLRRLLVEQLENNSQ